MNFMNWQLHESCGFFFFSERNKKNIDRELVSGLPCFGVGDVVVRQAHGLKVGIPGVEEGGGRLTT